MVQSPGPRAARYGQTRGASRRLPYAAQPRAARDTALGQPRSVLGRRFRRRSPLCVQAGTGGHTYPLVCCRDEPDHSSAITAASLFGETVQMLFACRVGKRPTDAGPLRFLIYCASRWHGRPEAAVPKSFALLLDSPQRCGAVSVRRHVSRHLSFDICVSASHAASQSSIVAPLAPSRLLRPPPAMRSGLPTVSRFDCA